MLILMFFLMAGPHQVSLLTFDFLVRGPPGEDVFVVVVAALVLCKCLLCAGIASWLLPLAH